MIIDCFTFFNELDLLEIRLNTLKDKVDHFVLVEATLTHQGKPKPLYYNENRHRFKEFENRITAIVVENYPSNTDSSAWKYEHHQRNCIMKGLTACKPEDIIIISDLDEIPNPTCLDQKPDKSEILVLKQRMYYYFLNCINSTNASSYYWNGSTITRFDNLKSPQELREISIRLSGLNHPNFIYRQYWKTWNYFAFKLKNVKVRLVNDGGWHFSYLGGSDAIIKKIEAFAHTEYNKPEFKEISQIEELITHGKDIFNREFTYSFVSIDDSFPNYITDNLYRFAHLIKDIK